MKIPECPECDKMIAVQDDSKQLGDFLDWLNFNGYAVCRFHQDADFPDNPYMPIDNFERLLADYFGIDLKKAEQEKQAVLKAIRC